ncbi:hypothetical protein [Nostoc sp.]|uniref:hypothetical protein n=1 Tax=Nostoc sp. TaxID=1180 RepID=UPI002FFA8AEA
MAPRVFSSLLHQVCLLVLINAAVKPGSAALILTGVSLSSAANRTAIAFTVVFNEL